MPQPPSDLRTTLGVPQHAPLGVLFVCLGNICRSPLAKAIFEHQAREAKVLDRFVIDSCGTGGWHAGEAADPRSRMVAECNGVHMKHVARRLDPDTDFEKFHVLLAMDERNRSDMIECGAHKEKVFLMRRFDDALASLPDHQIEVPDPYYGGSDGFEKVFDMLWRASEGLLRRAG